MSNRKSEAQARHWSKTFSLTVVVLILWFIFSFVVHWFAKDLNTIRFLGFPLGFYMAAQGSLIAFVILIFVQNWIQDGIDDTYEQESKE